MGRVGASGSEAAGAGAGWNNNTGGVVGVDAVTLTAEVAAAVAAAAANAAGTNSLNGLRLRLEKPFDGMLTAVQIETLLRAGVAPFEGSGEGAACVRAITTGRTGDASEGPHAALSTALAVDAVVTAVRGAVGTRLRGLSFADSDIRGIRVGEVDSFEIKGLKINALQAVDLVRLLGVEGEEEGFIQKIYIFIKKILIKYLEVCFCRSTFASS